MIYYQDRDITLYEGDVIKILKELPIESVNCVLTSPPYWGLRSYGTPPQIWGSGNGCEHKWGDSIDREHFTSDNKDFNARYSGNSSNGKKQEGGGRSEGGNSGNICVQCGAWKGELGLEPTPEMYISHLADVFDKVKRVLRKDGTVWINMGDTYGGSGGDTGKKIGQQRKGGIGIDTRPVGISPIEYSVAQNVRSKDLQLIPSRFAIEMQNRGWILRNDIIWRKPNPMPSSAKDRLTNCYEHLFFFVKSQKYWYDNDAIREERQGNTHARGTKLSPPSEKAGIGHEGWSKATAGVETFDGKKSARDVWSIATEPLPDEHYAAYPQKLCERPIKAGCPAKVCVECGKPRERIVEPRERIVEPSEEYAKLLGKGFHDHKDDEHMRMSIDKTERPSLSAEYKTIGWTKCDCGEGFKPGTVLDPFCGSGTTLLVAGRLGRKSIGIDLKYQKMVLKRLNVNQMRINI